MCAYVWVCVGEQPVQLVSYDSMGQAGYVTGPLRGVGANDTAFYGQPGDWRDTLPGLVGALLVKLLIEWVSG